MARVIRLFGKADSFDIEFSRKGEKWTVDIPPDMTDGVYAVQLTAVDENGDTAYWVGELFMCSGICHLKIEKSDKKCLLTAEPYGVTFLSVSRTGFSAERYRYIFSKNLGVRFQIERRENCDVRFSSPGGVSFSKSTGANFTVEKLRISSAEKKMLFRQKNAVSIRKECNHV